MKITSEHIEAYMARRKNLSPHTVRKIRYALGKLTGGDLTSDDIIDRLLSKSERSTSLLIGITIMFLEWTDGIGDEIEVLKIIRDLRRYHAGLDKTDTSDQFSALTEREEANLLAVVKDRHRPIIQFMLASGLRACEVAYLPKSTLERCNGGGVLTLAHAKGRKNGASRRPLLPRAVRLYNDAVEALDASTREPSPKSITMMVSRYMRKAKVKGYRPGAHTLRRTFATRCKNAGMDINDLKELMGHKSVNTTARYIKVDMARHTLKALKSNIKLL